VLISLVVVAHVSVLVLVVVVHIELKNRVENRAESRVEKEVGVDWCEVGGAKAVEVFKPRRRALVGLR
jgi:hypothetical protein